MDIEKKIVKYVGQSEKDLKKFPADVQEDITFQIDQVARGKMPDDFRPMNAVGSGTYEIRLKDGATWYRVFYVAKLGSKVYVLHAFTKNQNRTPPNEIQTGQKRYKLAAKLACEE
ncbi:type II toxin-antitoxin system RelE/ParE family toxin [Rhodococcus opacus]|uniref:type II toxin-antitoxin system RelE/ParE family toxin n=1 Tax=Rhodococcus opacus TaxID=37919 RepID=UPI00155AAA68|nr:type II toxin-antitoxin system RelE/ParE family toxin [Rhodococcus opacus]